MSKDKKTDAYLCVVRNGKKKFPTAFRAATEIDGLVEWAQKEIKNNAESQNRLKSNNNQNSESLESILRRINDTFNHQWELAGLTSAMVGELPKQMIEHEVTGKFCTPDNLIQKGENYEIFSIEKRQSEEVFSSLGDFRKLVSGLLSLPGAILLSLVATFDSQMSDVVKAMFRLNSDMLRIGDRHIPLSKIIAAQDISSLIEEAILEEVYHFLRGSHSEQVKYIEDRFSISIKKEWKNWPDFIEVFERRNLVAHGERLFNNRYFEICRDNGHKFSESPVGNKVKVTQKYLNSSIDILSEFAILLVFSLWKKHIPEQRDKAFEVLNEIVFDNISNRRSGLANRLCAYALSLKGSGIKEATRLMLIVNHASAQIHLKNEKAAHEILDSVDWSASSDDYKICVAALRKDKEEFFKLVPLIKASGKITLSNFREWPVFKLIRSDEEFQQGFLELYGDSIIVKSNDTPKIDAVTEAAGEDVVSSDTDASTVH